MPGFNSNENLFTSKLQEILEDLESHSIISWGNNQYTIEINDKARLLETVLPKYFRHNRFESFVRQMNLYGFKKIRSSKKHCFISLQLKNGKKLAQLKSKNQIKRQKNENSSFLQEQLNNLQLKLLRKNSQEFSSNQELSQKQNSLKQADEILKYNLDSDVYQGPIPYYYNQMMNSSLVQINPYQYYQNYFYPFCGY